MTEFRIGIEIGHLLPSGTPLGQDLFPNLAYAVQQVAEKAHLTWLAYAGGKPLPDGSTIGSRTGSYLRSIELARAGQFSAEVFSDAPHAKEIEEGSSARDLKRMLDTSMKVRVTKDGRRYLIIPFRWGTPGSTGFGKNVMPPEVHSMWRHDPEMKPSRVISLGQRQSGNGAYDIRTRSPFLVPQRQYNWGGRLTAEKLHRAGVHGQAAKRMTGMVNMQNPSGEGGGKHSQFLTFRIMVEGASGWLVPARPGKYPARTTADQIRPAAAKIFGQAVVADVSSKLGA